MTVQPRRMLTVIVIVGTGILAILAILTILQIIQSCNSSVDYSDKYVDNSDKYVDKSRPIDAVVTWVNTTDPEWIRSYEHHTGKTFKTGIRWTPETADPEAELSLCLELVRKNMPWVRNTYILTASPQRPTCLKDENLVHHHEIGLPPVFNSYAIESSLHHIPGIAENFIYLNDDFYVRLPVYPSSFLSNDGRPLLRFKPVNHSNNASKWINSLKSTAKIMGAKPIEPLHTPHSLTRTMMRDVENTFPTEWEATRRCLLRYTCKSEISPIVAAMNMALSNGKAIKVPDGLKNVFHDTLPSNDRDDIRDAHFVCINSLDGDRETLRHTLQID